MYSYAVHWDPCVFVIFVNCKDKLSAQRLNMLLDMNTQQLLQKKAIRMLLPNVEQIIELLNVLIAQNIS